jgi:membrane-associated protein
MDLIKQLFEFILHIDKHLLDIFTEYQGLSYGILFLIIFVETGLVIMPLLPGDSLLFAAGAIIASSTTDAVSLNILIPLLIAAAIIGDNTNYFIGKFIGDKVVDNKYLNKFIKKEYITKTETYFETHGGKTIIMARFIPIVRTFAPFVAGVGEMKYKTFLLFSIGGGALWVSSMTLLGYFFGNLDIVKNNFEIVVFGIIGISLLPVIVGAIKSKFSANSN